MTGIDLNRAAIESAQLQNGYAWAIDTRDWDYFRTLFTPDVVAAYPNETYQGMDSWLDFFIPFHDTCAWTQHMMTNHLVGSDGDGVWATCYGQIAWTFQGQPDRLLRAGAVYRDRLVLHGGAWRIARRRLDLVLTQVATPLPAGVTLPMSVLDVADVS
ncbi:nuclear transport factor 2 family protein [Frankia sp. CNm7]|uniref:Nuclear transport factor 2 family protein n=1 Tax=Frankia nepalensis TaxID=1836974 RepID=A0A937RKY3_9ACTN|nr:nuclear transport factor 2 family protein [Frankia nepalensis]MBL7499060.1 nuclear transport factor 2 family protein [Frankia nepalensis]MBL7514500.1 nuclear transport factor 2 family protein [Frankia nepalensis]MBL7520544.1 nuclear transport factor 2 family protein [Frankia nepalensis]MBL7632032.1 nuclear transport factor 2 family protein [Frankia nepalensis]